MTKGTVSSGTMRREDLIPAFEGELQFGCGRRDLLDKLRAEIMPPGEYDEYSAWIETDEAEYYLDGLFDALGECADEGFYFGSHLGDGADYGFWRAEELGALA